MSNRLEGSEGNIKLNGYHEFKPGQSLTFNLKTLNPNGTVSIHPQSCTIGRVHSGGFFGQVIEPVDEDFILKTPTPDPLHHFLRAVNLGHALFPAQINENKAQIEHLGARLIHDVLSPLTQGKSCSPNSLGYTLLNTGFAQVLEKMQGRGLRYDLGHGGEFKRFKGAQAELAGIAYRLGLEQVGQIHPDNPFAMSNLWWDERNNRWIWLDVNPAFRHTGRVWPFFNYKFQEEIRQYFKSESPTFNRIHTQDFRRVVERHRQRFPDELYIRIMSDLDLYDQLWEAKSSQEAGPRRNRAVTLNALSHVLIDAVPGIKNIAVGALIDPVKIIFSPEFRTQNVTGGLEEARSRLLISEDEYNTAIGGLTDDLSEDERRRRDIILKGLPKYYAATGQLLNLAEAAFYAKGVLGDDLASDFLTGFFVGWVLPCIFRFASTKAIGSITKNDLNIAAMLSALPKGLYTYAIVAQYALEPSRGSETIRHYFLRKIIAGMSEKLGGGWGSEQEAKLWNKFGKRLEDWVKPGR